ncbi:MAG: glycosyltransferase family 39 protein, partial [bacterium]|nr:glycosyltransferase family 39 protein [bacterium]
YLGKQLIGPKAAWIATLLYSFSAVVITYTRFSWNPNPAPFVSLIMIYATYRAWKDRPWYWVLVGLCFSILVQLHYLTLLSAGGAGLIWIISAVQSWRSTQRWRSLRDQILPTVAAVLIFLVSLTPLILFDLRHDGLNAKAFFNLSDAEQSFKYTDDSSLLKTISSTIREAEGRSYHILFEYNLGKDRTRNGILLLVVVLSMIYILTQKKRKFYQGEVVITAYLVTGIIGTAMYEHAIFDHYLAYLFPVTFMLFGILLGLLASNQAGKLLTFAAILYFLQYNLPRLPHSDAGWKLQDIKATSASIAERLSNDEQYSLVLLAPSKDLYGQNYRYYLTTLNTPPLPPERANEATTLVVINEDHTEDVASLPIYEIVTFPDKIVNQVYTIENGPEIIIYKRSE